MINVTEFQSPEKVLLVNKALAIESIANKALTSIFGGSEDYTTKFYSEKYGQFATSHSLEILDLLDNLGLKPEQVFIDLGSGDGKWVLIAALLGLRAYGVEHNPDLVKAAEIIKAEAVKQKIISPQQAQNATFTLGNLKAAEIKQADIILYAQGSGAGNGIVENKIRSEAKRGGIIVINGYINGFTELPEIDTSSRLNKKAKVFTIPANFPLETPPHPHL